jgi:drug/metabolite transporter (DMT)-like permease
MPTAVAAALAVAIAVLCWALTFPLIKIALIELAPMPIAATRFSIAALLAIAWLIWRRQRLPPLPDSLRFLLSGLTGIALYNFGQNYGQQTVAAGAASFIVNTAPIITMILSVIFYASASDSGAGLAPSSAFSAWR